MIPRLEPGNYQNPLPTEDKPSSQVTQIAQNAIKKKPLHEIQPESLDKVTKKQKTDPSPFEVFDISCKFSFSKTKVLLQDMLTIYSDDEVEGKVAVATKWAVSPTLEPPSNHPLKVIDETPLVPNYDESSSEEESSEDSEEYERLYNDLKQNLPNARILLSKFYEKFPELKSKESCRGALELTALLVAFKIEEEEDQCNYFFHQTYCGSLEITLPQLNRMEKAFLTLSEYKGFNFEMERPKPPILLWKDLIRGGVKSPLYTYEQYLVDVAKNPKEREEAIKQSKITRTYIDGKRISP